MPEFYGGMNLLRAGMKIKLMDKRIWCMPVTVLLSLLSWAVFAQDIQYGTGNWDRQKFGNHRAVITVADDTDIAWVHVPWRRSDNDPAGKAIIMVDAATGKVIHNVYTADINDEYGDIAFEPVTGKGIYYLYYLPYRTTGHSYCPDTRYLKPENHGDPGWLKKNNIAGTDPSYAKIPSAKVIRFEAINAFNSFYPMEVAATKQ